jgi:hypothetical protein
MNRREALQSLTALAGATGMSVTPVPTTHHATDVMLVILRVPGRLDPRQALALKDAWPAALKGTPLEGVKVVVLADGAEIELVRRREVEP